MGPREEHALLMPAEGVRKAGAGMKTKRVGGWGSIGADSDSDSKTDARSDSDSDSVHIWSNPPCWRAPGQCRGRSCSCPGCRFGCRLWTPPIQAQPLQFKGSGFAADANSISDLPQDFEGSPLQETRPK